MRFNTGSLSSRFETLFIQAVVVLAITLVASVAEAGKAKTEKAKASPAKASAAKAPKVTKNKEECYTPALIKEREQLIAKNLLNISSCDEARVKQFPKPKVEFEGITSYIKNGNGDTKSCAMVEKEYLASAIVDAFMAAVAESTKKIEKQPGNMAAVECLAEGLFRWADGNGMTVMTGDKGKELPRVRAANAAILSYLKLAEVRQFADIQSSGGKSKHKVILGWMEKLARQFKNGAESMIKRGELNNHIYIHGVGVMAAGLLINDQSMIQFGDEALRVATNQINDRGFIKEELTRGAQTLTYHSVSLSHLVALYSMSAAAPCHVGLSSVAQAKFIDLFVKVLEGQKNPEIFANAAGVSHLSKGTGTPAEQYLILLATTQPGFYKDLAEKIRSKTSVNPDAAIALPQAAKWSKAFLGGSLLELGYRIMDFRTDFKAKICGN